MRQVINVCLLTLSFVGWIGSSSASIAAVVNTWPWTQATDAAWTVLSNSAHSPIDAVQLGCKRCEDLQCDGTVGFGGSPDDTGETTLDAMIMDGDHFRVGSVGNLRRIKNAIGVARAVMEFTQHTLISGDQSTAFAVANGFVEEDLTTDKSKQMHQSWLQSKCQPNYRSNVSPDATKQCGPYKPTFNITDIPSAFSLLSSSSFSPISPVTYTQENHDTIAMVALHSNGSMASGTSTNGARNKIAGRIGDSPITGSGSFVDSTIGGCGGTGDGDVMMRFLPAYQAVESMRNGAMTPEQAAVDALARIAKFYPTYQGAMVCLNNKGEHGAAGHGWNFSYSVRTTDLPQTQVVKVIPFKLVNGKPVKHDS